MIAAQDRVSGPAATPRMVEALSAAVRGASLQAAAVVRQGGRYFKASAARGRRRAGPARYQGKMNGRGPFQRSASR